MDPQKAFDGILDYSLSIGHNDKFKTDAINNLRTILYNGVRFPEKIIEDIGKETEIDTAAVGDKPKRKTINL